MDTINLMLKKKVPKKFSPQEKLKELTETLKKYEDWLAKEMKGYRGVIHESASSEIKHNKVMVLRDMVASIKEEIKKLKE
ncbi:MAG: hypothetical protein NZM26_01510, partial [Patescibacteria group bacterium]|nr:hypothetical protein [Patescibacteria group bacterium]